jgi:hypothetical protein
MSNIKILSKIIKYKITNYNFSTSHALTIPAQESKSISNLSHPD